MNFTASGKLYIIFINPVFSSHTDVCRYAVIQIVKNKQNTIRNISHETYVRCAIKQYGFK